MKTRRERREGDERDERRYMNIYREIFQLLIYKYGVNIFREIFQLLIYKYSLYSLLLIYK